ncbi:MAG: hypothetical protein WC509_02975 [Candidatus Izemoplasmatales bacterium]
MDFDVTLKEYQAFPKNAELADKLLALQDETVKAGDAEAFLKATHLLTDTYLTMQATDEAVAMLSAVLRDNAFEDHKTIIAIVDRLVQLLLKTEDFVQLEQVLQYRARFATGVPSQTMMQQFYLSVCYEGLKKYDLAIAALVQVPDNISAPNLASKYLKLAMLYLKTQDLTAARNAYDHALVFDKAKKNEMFYLVESDILFADGRILNALKAYQDFFLRSKTKTRYLDRYITINARLGNFEEAWRFYKAYEKKAATNVSKNYRLELYEAGLRVAEALRRYDEAAQIKERILALMEKEPEIIDSFDGVRALLEAANRIPADRERRDVVLECFRALVKVAEVPRLLFVAPTAEGVLVETFSKGLLLDKNMAATDLAGTAIGAAIDADRDYLLLMGVDFGDLVDHVDNRPLKDGPIRQVVALKVRAVGSTAGFIVAYLDRERHFDFVSKLLVTARLVLEGKFDTARLREQDAVRIMAADHAFSAAGTGVFRIESGYLFLVDDRARSLLETDRGFIPFEEFQTRMGERKLYVDDFVGKKTLVFPVTGFSGRKMLWKAVVWTDGQAVHFLATDVREDEERAADALRKASDSYCFGLGTMHALDAAIKRTETQTALARWTASCLDDTTYDDWNDAAARLIRHVRAGAGTHLLGLYQGEDGSFLAHYDTIDKRILDRIAGATVDGTERDIADAIPRIATPGVRAGFVNLLRNRTVAESIAKARLACAAATAGAPHRHYDRDLIVWENRTEAVAAHLHHLIETDAIRPRYAQVGNVFTKKVELYRVSLHPDPVIGDAELLRMSVRRFGIAREVTRAMLSVVLKDMDALFRIRPIPIRFALPVYPATLVSPGFVEEILRAAKKRKVPLARLQFVVIPDGDVAIPAAADAIEALAEAGIAFGFDGRRDRVAPWEVSGTIEWDDVWIDPVLLDRPSFSLWEAYAQSTKATLVAAPVDDEALVGAVRNARIAFVEGGVLPIFDTIEELTASL